VRGRHAYLSKVKGDEAVITARVGAEDRAAGFIADSGKQKVQAPVLSGDDQLPGRDGLPFHRERLPGILRFFPNPPGLPGAGLARGKVACNIFPGNPYLLAHPGRRQLPPLNEFIHGVLFYPQLPRHLFRGKKPWFHGIHDIYI
jgi:hypothetical protein